MVQDRDGLVILCMAHCFFGTTSRYMCFIIVSSISCSVSLAL